MAQWAGTWGPWEGLAKTWLNRATTSNMYHVGVFHISESLAAVIPKEEMPVSRYRVAWHQYHCMHLAISACPMNQGRHRGAPLVARPCSRRLFNGSPNDLLPRRNV